jgi:hypothetical protein
MIITYIAFGKAVRAQIYKIITHENLPESQKHLYRGSKVVLSNRHQFDSVDKRLIINHRRYWPVNNKNGKLVGVYDNEGIVGYAEDFYIIPGRVDISFERAFDIAHQTVPRVFYMLPRRDNFGPPEPTSSPIIGFRAPLSGIGGAIAAPREVGVQVHTFELLKCNSSEVDYSKYLDVDIDVLNLKEKERSEEMWLRHIDETYETGEEDEDEEEEEGEVESPTKDGLPRPQAQLKAIKVDVRKSTAAEKEAEEDERRAHEKKVKEAAGKWAREERARKKEAAERKASHADSSDDDKDGPLPRDLEYETKCLRWRRPSVIEENLKDEEDTPIPSSSNSSSERPAVEQDKDPRYRVSYKELIDRQYRLADSVSEDGPEKKKYKRRARHLLHLVSVLKSLDDSMPRTAAMWKRETTVRDDESEEEKEDKVLRRRDSAKKKREVTTIVVYIHNIHSLISANNMFLIFR